MINEKDEFNPAIDPVIASGDGLSLHEYVGGLVYYIKYTGDLIACIPMLEDFNSGSVCSYKNMAVDFFERVLAESRFLSEHLKQGV